MGMYPAYTVEMALNEYAVRFFALLNNGYRRRHAHYRMLAQLSMLPHMEKEPRAKLLKQLDWAATDPSDILSSSGNANSEQDIKRFFGQK